MPQHEREHLTIGDFARRSGLSVSALRFYDGAGLLSPATVDPVNGYRLYAEDQLDPAALVRELRRLEMPLAAIQAFLVADADLRQKALREHVAGMSIRLREAEAIARELHARITKLEGSMTTMTVDAADFGVAIDQVLPAASTDPELPLLHTVLIEAREGSLRLVTTDRYRLAVRDLVPKAGEDATFRAVIASASLARIRPTLDVTAPLQLRLEEHHLILEQNDHTDRMSNMPAEFPPYERFFGIDPAAHTFVVERAALADLLDAMTDEPVVRVSVTKATLRLEVEGSQTQLPITYDGPDVELGLNPAFAHYAVSSAVGPEVVIDITEPNKPVVFRSATDSSYICMLMPIHLR